MIYFSGFCLENEKELFSEYLEEGEFVVAGFSKGAQEAIEYVLNTSKRVDKLQLLSPAFFDYNEKLIDINLKAFRKDKRRYIENFLAKAGLFKGVVDSRQVSSSNEVLSPKVKVRYDCSEEELLKLFTFNWEKIELIKNIKIEVFLGEFDKIIALKKAERFFKDFGTIYLIKKVNHFLRS